MPQFRTRRCPCRQPPFRFSDYDTIRLGEDSHGADVSLSTCRSCGAAWLVYLIEEPQHSRSGRWWRVAIPAADRHAVSTATAREVVERSAEGFAGGSYFDSPGHAVGAPIKVA